MGKKQNVEGRKRGARSSYFWRSACRPFSSKKKIISEREKRKKGVGDMRFSSKGSRERGAARAHLWGVSQIGQNSPAVRGMWRKVRIKSGGMLELREVTHYS